MRVDLHYRRLRVLRSAQNVSDTVAGFDEEPNGHLSNSAPRCDEASSPCPKTIPDAMCTPGAQLESSATTRLLDPEYHCHNYSDSTVDQLAHWNSNLDFVLETNYIPTEQDLLIGLEPHLLIEPISGFSFSTENLISELSTFFRQAYVAYPLVHHNTLVRKVNEGWHIWDREFRALILSIAVLNEACKVRLSPQHDPRAMKFLVRIVENLRIGSDGYHFAENPSIDTVIVSIFLFVAYSVSNKHNRAFCYLTEAIGLSNLVVEPSNQIERTRQKRLSYVLYITESATVSIYGSHRSRIISPRPSDPLETISSLSWYNQEGDAQDRIGDFSHDEILMLDKQAVELLLLMTRLHLATDVSEVAQTMADDRLICSITTPFESSACTAPLRYDTQIADVAITRQWKLARLWWKDISRQPALVSSEEAINSTVEAIATTTLTWSKTLQPRYLRILGLGKLVDLIDSISNISTSVGRVGACTALVRHLIQTVAETDYDGYFAPRLSMMEICIGDIPRSLISDGEFGHFGPGTVVV